MNGHNPSCRMVGGGMKKTPNNVPMLRIQPETPVPPSTQTTPIPVNNLKGGVDNGGGGGGLPALSSSRSLINGGQPSPQPSPRFSQNAATGQFKHFGSHPSTVPGFGRSMVGFQGRVATSDVAEAGSYGPQCISLAPRQGDFTDQSYGHQTPRQVVPHSQHLPSSLGVRTSGQGSFGANNNHHQLHLPSQALQTHTPTPSEISNITARSVTSPRQSLHTPMSSSLSSDRAALSTPGAFSSNSGVGVRGGSESGSNKHVFLEPLPKQQDWHHYKPLPSVASHGNGSIGSSSEMDQNLHLASSSSAVSSQYPGGSNLSPSQGLDMSPFPSRFTTPRPSAQGNSRNSQKRTLSISPSLSDGLDLNQLIRISPTSLTFLNNSRGSSTSVSPQPGQPQGSFSHMVRNISPYTNSAYAGQRYMSIHTPQSSYGGIMKSENSHFYNMGPPEMSGGYVPDFMTSNAYVARQSEMPYIEHSCANGQFVSNHLPNFHINTNVPSMGCSSHAPYMGMDPSLNTIGSDLNSAMNNIGNIHSMTSGLSMRPPPSYTEAVEQQHQQIPMTMVGAPQQQQQHESAAALANLISSSDTNGGIKLEDGEEDNGLLNTACMWFECGQTFREQEELVRHIEKAHIDQRKGEDFTCYWAGCQRQLRSFNARYKLLIHMRVHSGEKPNKCSYDGCNKAFSRLENLKIHLRSHTGERPYLCQHEGCMKSFSNSSDRAKHQRTHQDTKPYACTVPGCSKRYTDPSSLRKHFKNHNREQQQKKRLKKGGGELSIGGDILNDCLTIQQLRPEGSPMEHTDSGLGRSPQGSMPSTSSDIYPSMNFSSTHSSRCGTAAGGTSYASQQSPNSLQSSPMNNSGPLGIVEENNESMGTYSPGPQSSILSPRSLPSIHRQPMSTLPGIPAAYGQASYPYGHQLQSNMMASYTQSVPRQPLMNTLGAYVGPSSCRMGAMQAQRMMYPQSLEEQLMNMPVDGMHGTFPQPGFDLNISQPIESMQVPPEPNVQQYLQLTALNRCNSRLSAVYADGST